MSFEHLKFKRHWELSEETAYKLGQCQALVDCIADVPLSPEVKKRLGRVYLIKGAQASTAIEGNTLTDEEIKKIVDGEQLPKSKAYQEQEFRNIIDAMRKILGQIQDLPEIVTPDLLREYHHMVGKDLPTPFNAVPGQFAQSQRVVGGYRCPPPGRKSDQVDGLVKQLCDWLPKEFKFVSHEQAFKNDFLKAIVTHVYIELIHPFDDGNGRTGRLVEFYLLLRAGVPDICSLILTNHYNKTRSEYYDYLKKCQNEKDLTSFIGYAVSGFFDGINEVWETVTSELFRNTWRGHVYDTVTEMKWSKSVTERRRQLLLGISPGRSYDMDNIKFKLSIILRKYGKANIPTINRDIKNLIDAKLLVMDPKTKKVSANTDILSDQYPKSRGNKKAATDVLGEAPF